MKNSYLERRLLRTLERVWACLEGYITRLTTPAFNPLYHLGTLAIFLLIVLTVTGIYLTIFYRPGAGYAYTTVAEISAAWLGSLMRSVHRYASDALVLVILLHALKMLFSDRFWGSRWLAWASGWVLLVLLWVIGVMGYWLVWDQRAQWLTEYGISLLQGPVVLSFIQPDMAAETFTFFVIILFLHIFLCLPIAVGVIVHVLRLPRVRYWAPRWLMVETGVVLVLLALWRPVSSAPEANLNRLVGMVTLDGWYLGFLPFAAQWGNVLFWGVATLLLGVVIALPWLAKGRSLGPAIVNEALCSGCTLCARECPYGAIEMKRLSESAKPLAVVQPRLCTGCGVCVGACPTDGIALAGLPTGVVRERLAQSLAETPGTVVFACQRHAALGTLSKMSRGAEVQGSQGAGEWGSNGSEKGERWKKEKGEQGEKTPFSLFNLFPAPVHPSSSAQKASLHFCTFPCVGMVHPGWIKESLAAKGNEVIILGCPPHDCAFQEGPRWLAARLKKRRALVEGGMSWLEVVPGDGACTPARPEKSPRPARSLSAIVSLGVVAIILGLALVVEWPVVAAPADQGMLRVVLVHSGQLKATSAALPPEVKAKLPQGTSPEQVLGGERFPVRLRMEIDADPPVEWVYWPGGLRREGAAYALESWSLPPGEHQVRLWLMDDEAHWRPVFSAAVEVKAGRVHSLTYDRTQGVFVPHEW